MQIDFPPYQAYLELLSQIDEFGSLSECSYGLAQQLLFKHPKDTVRALVRDKPTFKQLSFSMGDQRVDKVDLTCEWVTVEVYAEREKIPVCEAASAVDKGNLGPVRTGKDGTRLVLWPSKYHTMDESKWPDVGKKKYSVTLTVTAKSPHSVDPTNLDAFDETQQEYLRLAHALGEPSKVADRAGELLNRSLFLLEWIAFEVFLRSTVQELIRRHPSVLASGKRGKDSVTLEEIIKLSKGLSDITVLRDNLANREIERQEHGGESIHGLLNLLKSQFKFKTDPYDAWYVLRGVRKRTSYSELMEFKDTRNVLAHDAGRASIDFQKAYPSVPLRNGVVVVEDEFYLRVSLALRSVSYLVADSISSGKYLI